jgi:2-polyprenyl-3-methyl-5-hydroxy-6-metoxy-1,4-benzoquinol methylase
MIVRHGIENKEGIVLFAPDIIEQHADYNAKGLDNIYAAEEKHFWFLSRKQCIISAFQQYVSTNESILEIGAGTGNVAQALQNTGYENLAIGDIHLNGLTYAKNYGIKQCYQFDLFNSPFLEHFNVISMFDVLEHLQDDVAALNCVNKMLNANGRIILTVPAHQWLWCRDDAIAAHKRRYTLSQLQKAIEQAGFQVLYKHYFFASIVPLLLLRRVLNPDTKQPITESEYNIDININPLINKFLLKLTSLENRFASFMPNIMGGSIILVAQKLN